MGDEQERQPDRPHRSIAVIRSELREVERHLVDVPPHHGGGRGDLAARADALRRELARAEAARARGQQSEGA